VGVSNNKNIDSSGVRRATGMLRMLRGVVGFALLAACHHIGALAAGYESLRVVGGVPASARPSRTAPSPPASRGTTTTQNRPFDPRTDSFELVKGFDCDGPGLSAEAWGDQGAVMLSDFAEYVQGLPDEIPPHLMADMDVAVMNMAQRYYCAVKQDPDNMAYLEGLANSLARARERFRGEQAMSVMQRCLQLSSRRNAEVMYVVIFPIHGQT
jgi:hypothetical protein